MTRELITAPPNKSAPDLFQKSHFPREGKVQYKVRPQCTHALAKWEKFMSLLWEMGKSVGRARFVENIHHSAKIGLLVRYMASLRRGTLRAECQKCIICVMKVLCAPRWNFSILEIIEIAAEGCDCSETLIEFRPHLSLGCFQQRNQPKSWLAFCVPFICTMLYRLTVSSMIISWRRYSRLQTMYFC